MEVRLRLLLRFYLRIRRCRLLPQDLVRASPLCPAVVGADTFTTDDTSARAVPEPGHLARGRSCKASRVTRAHPTSDPLSHRTQSSGAKLAATGNDVTVARQGVPGARLPRTLRGWVEAVSGQEF